MDKVEREKEVKKPHSLVFNIEKDFEPIKWQEKQPSFSNGFSHKNNSITLQQTHALHIKTLKLF